MNRERNRYVVNNVERVTKNQLHKQKFFFLKERIIAFMRLLYKRIVEKTCLDNILVTQIFFDVNTKTISPLSRFKYFSASTTIKF